MHTYLTKSKNKQQIFRKVTRNYSRKKMDFQSSEKYFRKGNTFFKWLFLPLGLDIINFNDTIQHKKYCCIIFFLLFIYQLAAMVYYSSAFVAFLFMVKPEIEEIVYVLSYIIGFPVALITYFLFYQRRIAIASVINNIIYLPATKMFSQKHWKYIVMQVLLVTVLHLVIFLSEQIITSTHEKKLEEMCAYYVMSESLCKNEHVIQKVLVVINIMETLQNILGYFFISLSYCFFSYVCKLLTFHFQQIIDEIQEKIQYEESVNNFDISKIKKKFLVGKQLMETVSQTFSPLILMWWIYSIVCTCITIRLVSNMDLLTLHHLAVPILEVVRFYMLYKNASDIYKLGKSVTEYFATLEPVHGDEFHFNHLYFLLQSSDVGINASGLFIVDTDCILNVSATILTYAVILFQTK